MLIPPALLQGLQHATPEQLNLVEIVGRGTGLHWPTLNVDHWVAGLSGGVFGSRRWMAAIRLRGTQARSRAKIAAVRRSGRPAYRSAANH